MILNNIDKATEFDNMINSDIKDLYKLSNDELIKEILKLKKEKQIYEDFLLNISHDLRSPLNIILSALQCYNDIKYNNHANIIKRNCYKMLKLVNNLIDTTKLYKKYYNLNLINTDIISLIEGDIELIDKYAHQKNISLIFDTNIEECFTAIDPEAIDRIITNLLSNSIKFSPENSNIYINVWSLENELSISIKDQGIGIPLKEQTNIFTRFSQSSKNKHSEYEGSGIGLDLVRSLTEAHDGNITLISEENKGCEFILKFPIKKIQELICENKEFKSHKKVDILEVEFSDIYL